MTHDYGPGGCCGGRGHWRPEEPAAQAVGGQSAPSWVDELTTRAPLLGWLATWYGLDDEVDVDQLEANRTFLEPYVAAARGQRVPEPFSNAWHALPADDPLRLTATVLGGFARWAEEHGLGAPTTGALKSTSLEVSEALAEQRRDDHARWAAHDEAERYAEAELAETAEKAWDAFIKRRGRQPQGRAA